MTTETRIHKNRFDYETKILIESHETDYLSIKGRACLDMILRWGMVAADNDGEDSTGRSRLKLQPVSEVIDRAIKMTQALFEAIEGKGWVCQLPTIDEANKIVEDEEARKVTGKAKAKAP